MKKTYLIGGGITLLATAILAGCNSNDHDQPITRTARTSATATTTVTITPSLGKITNARVILRNARNGAILGSGTTGVTGIATIKAIKTLDPVITEVQLPKGTQYFDEAKGAVSTVTTDQTIHAALPSMRTNFGVTPLTDLAYQAALKASATETALTVDLINQANTQIQQTLATGISDILMAPTVIADADLSDDITVNSAANSYALLLASLAKLGSGSTPILDALAKLRTDMDDGVFNGANGGSNISYNLTGGTLADAINQYLKAVAQATAALKALYSDTVLNRFIPNFDIPVSVVHQGPTGFGLLVATSIPGNVQQFHVATGFAETTTGDITTAKWSEPGSSFSVNFNKTTGAIQSVKIQGDTSDDFLQCLNTACTGLTLNLTTKQLLAHDFKAAVNTVPNTATFRFNGVLNMGKPSVPPITDCGNLTTLALADLSPFAKNYTVNIFKTNGAPGSAVKTNVSLQVNANGAVSLDGQTATVKTVCDNDQGTTQGVMVILDKPAGGGFPGSAHIDFFSNGNTNGDDFTNTSAEFRFFDNTTTIGGGGSGALTFKADACTGPVSTACGASVVNDFSQNLKELVSGSACTISKSGSVVTLTQGATTISAVLNNSAGDFLSQTPVSNTLTIGSNEGLTSQQVVILHTDSAGNLTQASGTVGTATSLVCTI